jgi:hypothetical protein
VSRGTQEPDKGASLVSPTGLAPCIADHSRSFGYEIGFLLPGATAVTPCPVLQHPECNAGRLMHIRGLGCSLFARRYWGNRDCFLFLRVLRWFTSPGWLRHPMYSDGAIEDYPRWVAPFGNLRVKACLRLTEAYRSLPRPSSPSCAKASTVRP